MGSRSRRTSTFESIIPGSRRTSTTSGCPRSRSPRSARRRSTSSPTPRPARRSTSEPRAGRTSVARRPLRSQRSPRRRGPPRQDDATAQDKKCKAAGKPGVNVSVFPDENGVNLALSSGRADVGMADSPVAAYAVSSRTASSSSPASPTAGRYGIAMPKDSGMAPAGAGGRQGPDGRRHLQEDLRLLGHRSRSDAITNPKINPTNVPASSAGRRAR